MMRPFTKLKQILSYAGRLYRGAAPGREQKPRPHVHQDTRKSITQFDQRALLSAARQLYAQLPPVTGAILEKNCWAIGNAWQPQYIGSNADWGRRAEAWILEWAKICNVRGEPYDFYTDRFLDGVDLDRDGDNLLVLVRGAGGYPLYQIVPAHRVGNRTGERVIEQGRFKGATIYNGVIFGNAGRVLGYRILGETQPEDIDVGIANAQLLYEPEWSDQGRGLSKLSASLLDWMDIQDVREYLKLGVKADSAIGFLHFNETGSADVGKSYIDGATSTNSGSDVQVEKLEGGQVLYFKTNAGNLESFKTDRPHPNVPAFLEHVARGCFKALEWPFELQDPSAVGGASVRMVIDQARNAIEKRQRTLRKRSTRVLLYALARAAKLKLIPALPTDWFRWEFQLPEEFTVDVGRDGRLEIERYKAGMDTLRTIYGRRGKWWEDEIRQRITEAKFIEQEAERLGVDVRRVQLLTPNDTREDEQAAQNEDDTGSRNRNASNDPTTAADDIPEQRDRNGSNGNHDNGDGAIDIRSSNGSAHPNPRLDMNLTVKQFKSSTRKVVSFRKTELGEILGAEVIEQEI